jgi:hypothetical protein
VERLSGQEPYPVVMIHKQDGRLIERFESASKAAKALGLDLSTVTRQCQERRLGSSLYMLRWESEWRGGERFLGRRGSPIVCDHGDGYFSWHCNNKNAAIALGCLPQALSNAVRNGWSIQTCYGKVKPRKARDTAEWAELIRANYKAKELNND